MPWLSSGIITNPTAGQVLLDSGPLSAGTREVQLILSSNAIAFCELQLRNAANNGTRKSQVITVPANQCMTIPFATGLDNEEGERYRVVSLTSVTGSVSISVIG